MTAKSAGPFQLFLALLLLLALAGCQPGSVRKAGDFASRWKHPKTLRVNMGIVVYYGGVEIPAIAVMDVNGVLNSARVVGMADAGVKLFDVSVENQGETANFLFDRIGKIPGFKGLLGDGVRRIFLDPAPTSDDNLIHYGQDCAVTKNTGEGYLIFKGSCEGAPTRKYMYLGQPQWEVDYGDNKKFADLDYFSGARYHADESGFGLLIRVDNVRVLDDAD